MTLSDFLWGILPYIVATIFIGGHIYRYQHDQFGWTTKSSEFLEKKRLKIGSRLLHWGLLFVIAGHVIGLFIPIDLHRFFGIKDGFYHGFAISLGLPAGIIVWVGLVILLLRRINVLRIRKTTSFSDWVSLILLWVVVTTGLLATIFNIDSKGFDYRTTISPWIRGLLIFRIQPDLMNEVPVMFKIHILSSFALYIAWPFTRLVHAFSFPLRYLGRSYVIYKQKEAHIPNKETRVYSSE